MSIVKTSPVADFKSRRLKMMSVPESQTAVGRPDGINGRDIQTTARYAHLAADPIKKAANAVSSDIEKSMNWGTT